MSASMEPTRRKPTAVRYGSVVRVRLPPDMERAVRAARRILGINLSTFIRAGIEQQLRVALPKAIAIAKDPDANPRLQLKMIQFLQQARKGNLALHYPEVLTPPKQPDPTE